MPKPRSQKNPEFLRFRPYRAFTGISPEQRTTGNGKLWAVVWLVVILSVAAAVTWFVRS